MNIQELRDRKLIIFEGIVGSQAYGTATPESDIDIKGVYIQPINDIIGFKYVEQVNDDSHDTTYYEIRRFIELLSTNNPNILELLNLPEDKILYKHPIFDELIENRDKFISKSCKGSFAGYAIAQIKKARGLNKKIVNPVDKERKSPLDFCYVLGGNRTKTGTLALTEWLKGRDMVQENCGLINAPNARDVYAVYYHYENKHNYKGVVKEKDGEFVSNELRLSSIPKGNEPICFISYNKDGYTKYCKDYKEYWDWVANRNTSRYNDTAEHGKGYDGKNMAHCHRLLDMAIEIAQGEGVKVRRENAEQLLSIRRGEYEYDLLVSEAESKIKLVDDLFDRSELPEKIDSEFMHDLAVDIRKTFSFPYCEETEYINTLKEV